MPRGIGRAKPKDTGYEVGDVEVVKIAQSGKAFLVRMPDNDEMWFPFSQLHDNSDLTQDVCEVGETYQLVVTTWVAQQKGLEDGDGF